MTEVRDGIHQDCCRMVRDQANWPSLLRAGEEGVWEGTHMCSGSVSNDSQAVILGLSMATIV